MKLRHGLWIIAALLVSLLDIRAWAEEDSSAPTETSSSEPDTSEQQDIANQTRQLPDISLKQSLYLEKHMGLFDREEELTLLNTDTEEFFGLFLSERSGSPNGAVLILHDAQQHGHWPQVVAPLREYLPDYGWASLTLELPDAPAATLPARETGQASTPDKEQQQTAAEGETTQEQTANQPAQPDEADVSTAEAIDSQGPDTSSPQDVTPIASNEDDYEPALPRLEKLPELPADIDQKQGNQTEQAQQDAEQVYLQAGRNRINSAIEYLQQQKGQLNLAIIGVGQGASWAIDYVSRYSLQLDPAEENKGMVIITIDPDYQQDIIPAHEQQMTDISLPYLELLTREDGPSLFFAKRRQGKMKHAKRQQYQQIRFTQLASPTGNSNDLIRRIRGWLKTNASGTQVRVKE